MTLPVAHAERESYAGLPSGSEVKVLQNPGFVVGYSDARRQPLWVTYRAEALKGRPGYRRMNGFEPDPRVPRPVRPQDYTRSGYTRGHLAPAYLIGRLYGRVAQRATHLMSNIAPQKPRLNELLWQRLEEAEGSVVAPGAVELWVATGPVFGGSGALKRSGIALPEAFYRVWLDLRDGQPTALAFLVPQSVCGNEPLSQFLTTIDEVERRAGLDFFHELEDAQEAELERSHSTEGWRLERYDALPARYADKYRAQRCQSPMM
ncbi:MAG: DNA/RNA non-specific endonuclease [Gammaproteobacteria bacterium]